MKILFNNNSDFNYYISGLVQADGSFGIRTHRKSNNIYISPYFNLTLHSKHVKIIEDIKNHFNVGYYRIDNKGICRYYCSNIKDLKEIIIYHFDKFPLFYGKHKSYIMFKYIVEKLYKKEHIHNCFLKQELIMIGFNMNSHYSNREKTLLKFLNKTQLEKTLSDD
jgi:hypothetical protein